VQFHLRPKESLKRSFTSIVANRSTEMMLHLQWDELDSCKLRGWLQHTDSPEQPRPYSLPAAKPRNPFQKKLQKIKISV